MDKKNINIIICLLSCLFLISACGKTNDSNKQSNKDSFSNNAQTVIDEIKNNIHDGNIDYYFYTVNNGYINDGIGFEYDVSIYGIDSGVVFENSNHQLYISLESENYCVIKDFTDENYVVYDISEKEKCHKFFVIGDDLNLTVSLYNMDEQKFYNSGDVSNNYISLLVRSNLVDQYAGTYKWYRNGEEIPDSNLTRYVVLQNFEDASYYVEFETYDGQIFKSEPVNVKINKA